MNFRVVILCVIAALCLLSSEVSAQYKLRITQASLPNAKPAWNWMAPDKDYSSPETRDQALQTMLDRMHAAGWIEAHVSKLETVDSLTISAEIQAGTPNAYTWARLDAGNIDEGVQHSIGFRDKLYNQRPFEQAQVEKLFEQTLVWCENNGYPFATIQLDSVQFDNTGQFGNDPTIRAKLKLTKNQLVTIDSIQIVGDARISPLYLYNYLGIKPTDPYNEAAISRIESRLKELPVVRMSKQPRVIFTKEYTKLQLFLDHKKASLFNGIVGFLPDPSDGSILFTGDVRLKLINSFSRAETIDLQWKKTQENTQDLRLTFNYPFVANTPFGTDLTFQLLRRDTLYSDLNLNGGVQYLLTGGNFLKAFVNNRQLTLLSTDQYRFATTLPEFADVQVISYGLGLRNEKLDYRLNPRKGWSAELTASLGTKEIKQNPDLPEDLYSNLDLNSLQFNGTSLLRYFVPLGQQTTLMLSNRSGYLRSPNLFENELFRLGGFQTLRGFDEESIFASLYAINTAELRLLLEQNSYLYAFGDWAYLEAKSVVRGEVDRPFGFGAGISFETRAGIFALSYALGRQQGNPLDLRAGKIHFGFVSLF